MLENRPILTVAIGYILGIIMGLYCKFSIVLFYVVLFFIYLIVAILKKEKTEFKLVSLKRYSRYVKLLFTKKVIIIGIIFSIISNTIVLYQNQKYNTLYVDFDTQEIELIGVISSNAKESDYKRTYKLKVKMVNNDKKYKNTYVYVSVSKSSDKQFKYGDMVKLTGEYIEPSGAKNYKGFDYKEYLKSIKIYGIVELNSSTVLQENSISLLSQMFNNMFLKYQNSIDKNFDKDTASLLLGLTLGYTQSIDEKIKQNFSESNISHILAISGMHVSYIASILIYVFNKMFGKRKSIILTNIFLIIYMSITGFSTSVMRACIMYIVALSACLLCRKSDTWNNIGMALLIILIYNPFLIQNLSLQLSFLGTIGILVFERNFSKNLHEYIHMLNYKNKYPVINEKGKLYKCIIKIADSISVTFSACIAVIPIIATSFNIVPFFSILVSAFISLIISPIIIIAMITVFIPINFIQKILSIVITPLIKFLIFLAKVGSLIPFNKIYVKTPSIWQIIIYYLIVIFINIAVKIYNKKKITSVERRFKNLLSLAKYNMKKNNKKIIVSILIICTIFTIIKIVPKNLKIYFIDVGQGDCTLIVTPRGKKILIDGGGSEFGSYDVGKNTLLPYLLDRKINKIDYIMISHLDTDHVGGLFYVIENLRVEKVVISKQQEKTENLEKLIDILNQGKVQLELVEAGDFINIEKNLNFNILWPDSKNFITDNAINNNSIVAKLVYKDFSMLFTGDIEEVAENRLVNMYKSNNTLKSTVLKIPHHGSKSSSTKEFLEKINPKIALIGVGENNRYGHPSEDIIKRLERLQCLIFRTDLMGEIMLESNGMSFLYVNKM